MSCEENREKAMWCTNTFLQLLHLYFMVGFFFLLLSRSPHSLCQSLLSFLWCFVASFVSLFVPLFPLVFVVHFFFSSPFSCENIRLSSPVTLICNKSLDTASFWCKNVTVNVSELYAVQLFLSTERQDKRGRKKREKEREKEEKERDEREEKTREWRDVCLFYFLI